MEKSDEKEQKDREFKLFMSEEVWMKVKGYPIPECFSEKDRIEVFERYWHRAMEKE